MLVRDVMIDQQVKSATADVSGGARVFVRSSTANPISLSALVRTPGVSMVAPLEQTEASFALRNSPEEHFWPLTAFDDSLLEMGPPTLEDRSIPVKLRRKRPDEKVEPLRSGAFDEFRTLTRMTMPRLRW